MIKSEPAGCPPFWFQSDDVAILGNKKQFVRTENGVDDKGGRKKSSFADLSSGEGGGVIDRSTDALKKNHTIW